MTNEPGRWPSQAEFDALACEVKDVKRALEKVLKAQSIECILGNMNGQLEKICGQLAPLESLAPSHDPPANPTKLDDIAIALSRPDPRKFDVKHDAAAEAKIPANKERAP